MEIKKKSLVDEPEKTADSLLKQQINNFLINYFGYLTLALAFIIFAVGWFLFIYPQYQQLAKGNGTAEKSLRTEYEAKDRYLSAVRDLKNSYQLISAADRKKIEGMVPVSNEVISLITEIESIVLKNGVVLNSIKIEAEDSQSQPKAKTEVQSGEKQEPPAGIFGQLPEGVGRAKIEINLSSVNYQVLKNLLKTFENNLRLLDIAKINYNVQENKAVFTVYAYYFFNWIA